MLSFVSRSLPFLSICLVTTLLSCGVKINPSSLAADAVPFDTDGDGIGALGDRCPNTDFDAIKDVDANGCSKDDKDGDGVPDVYDQCPSTPAGKKVNSFDGCMIVYYMGSVNIWTVADDGTKYATPIYAFGYETTEEAVKESVMSLIDQSSLMANQYVDSPVAAVLDLPGANTDPCKVYSCMSSPSTGGSLGSSGSYNSSASGPMSSASGSDGSLTPDPAITPTILAGGALTGTVVSEDLASDLLNYGYVTLSSNPYATKLISLTKIQVAVAGNLTENMRAPQVSAIVSYFNQASYSSLKVADELYAANKAGEAEAYMYMASVLIDASYDIGTSDVASRLGGNEEVPSIYRNLYEAFTGFNVQGPEAIESDARTRALLNIVKSEIGKKMLQPGNQARQVASFGILFKRLLMISSGDEASIDALIEAAKTI